MKKLEAEFEAIIRSVIDIDELAPQDHLLQDVQGIGARACENTDDQ